MTEILTESFYERCGTRYTFESAHPRARLKGVKVLSRGLKNFVMSDDTSIDEAMAAARSDTDRELTAHQLDAFHKTFNFCMSCRQYTCPNCWNEAEARCLTCAPHLGNEVMPAPFPDLVTSSYLVADPVETAVTNGSNGHDVVVDDAIAASSVVDIAEDRPASGVDVADFAARLQALMAPADPDSPAEKVAETVVTAKVIDEVIADAPAEAAAEETSAADAEPPTAEPIAEIEAAAVEPLAADIAPAAAADTAESDESGEAAEIAARLAAWGAAAAAFDAAKGDEPDAGQKGAAQTGGLLRRFRAGQSLDAELEAYERDQVTTPAAGEPDAEAAAAEAALAAAAIAADEPEIEAEAVATFEPEPEAVATSEPVLEPEVEPEPVAAIEPEPVAAIEPEPVAAIEPEPVAAIEPEPVAAIEPEPVAAIEPEPVAAIEPEPVAAIEPEAPVAVEPEPEPIEVEPEPVAAKPAAEPEPTPAVELVDVIQQPTWRMVAPDPTIEAPATPPISPSIPAAATAPDPNAEPQWPTRAGAAPSVGLPFLNRPPAATGGLEALWAESARDVVAQPTVAGRPVATGGVQPCVSCGLSLSATARFCRRCGTPQAV